MRQWLSLRALMLHVAFLAIAAGCLTAAWWQVNRAMQGNTLSYLYSVEWPVFVVVAGIGWWQMVHDTPEDIENRRRFHDQMRQASAAVVARTLPRSALAIEAGARDAGPGRVLGEGSEPAGQLGSGGDSTAGADLVPLGANAAARWGAGETGGEADGDTDEMSEYNRYLALLAVKGKAKTWRNPRGL